jgi:hypothetical protein
MPSDVMIRDRSDPAGRITDTRVGHGDVITKSIAAQAIAKTAMGENTTSAERESF